MQGQEIEESQEELQEEGEEAAGLRRSLRKRRAAGLSLSLSLAAVLLAALGPGAQASPVTVGQLFAPSAASCNGFLMDLTVVQTNVSGGNPYSIPTDGLITSWSFQSGVTVVPQLRLKVVRLSKTEWAYEVIGQSEPVTQAPSAVNSYPVSIPVQAKDRIGIFNGGGDCAGYTGDGGDVIWTATGDPAPGTTVPFFEEEQVRVPVTVTVKPRPSLTGLSPSAGPAAGGNPVTISGADLDGATAVSFGGRPADFRVESETEIVAFAPAGAVGDAAVRVATPAGDSPVVEAGIYRYNGPDPEPAEEKPRPAGERTWTRWRAIEKCRAKRTKTAKKKCRKRAKKLPL
jgi:hypothetical protein